MPDRPNVGPVFSCGFLIDWSTKSIYDIIVKFAFIQSNLVDLWAEPRFNSERASQCFFGEPVKVLELANGFARVEQTDGYTGWVKASFLAPADKVSFETGPQANNFVVAKYSARVFDTKLSRTVQPHLLYYGTKLSVRPDSNGLARVRLGKVWLFSVKLVDLKPINSKKSRVVTGRDLVAEASKFLGVPYLWGGVTSVGFDCSGVVRTILARFNIYMPRDTKDQVSVGEKVERERIKTGDLLYFKRHVGIAIGKDRLIHSSVGGNGVRINSLVPGGPDYREDLDREFHLARRIICCTLPR